MMDYGFNNFERVTAAPADHDYGKAPVIGGSQGEVAAMLPGDLKVVVPKGGASVSTKVELAPVQAPFEKGATVGTLKAFVNGSEAACVRLCAAQAVGISLARRALSWFKAGVVIGACLVVCCRSGTAFTKNSRRRGRRIAPSL